MRLSTKGRRANYVSYTKEDLSRLHFPRCVRGSPTWIPTSSFRTWVDPDDLILPPQMIYQLSCNLVKTTLRWNNQLFIREGLINEIVRWKISIYGYFYQSLDSWVKFQPVEEIIIIIK